MAESDLSVTFTTLRKRIALEVGYDRDPTNWTTDQAADVDHILDAALRQVYRPPPIPGESVSHTWSFMRPITTLTTTVPYSTGTVTATNGSFTISGGTVPSWMDDTGSGDATQAEVVVSSGVYEVAANSSTTVFTTVDATIDVTAGSTYSLRRRWYTLPDDFAGIIGPMTYDSNFSYRERIDETSEAYIRILRQNDTAATRPRLYAIVPKAAVESTTAGQRWRMTLHPSADAAYVLQYRYNKAPVAIDASNPYPLGGEVLSELLQSAVLWEANKTLDDGNKPYLKQEFYERLSASVQHDRIYQTPDWLGTNTDPSTQPDLYSNRPDSQGRRDFYHVKINGITPGL